MASHYRPRKKASDGFVDASETIFLKRTECRFFFVCAGVSLAAETFTQYCVNPNAPLVYVRTTHRDVGLSDVYSVVQLDCGSQMSEKHAGVHDAAKSSWMYQDILTYPSHILHFYMLLIGTY